MKDEKKQNGCQGDYNNIAFNTTLTLRKGVVYNYTTCTGSYPQIYHQLKSLLRKQWNGEAVQKKRFDANGKRRCECIKGVSQ